MRFSRGYHVQAIKQHSQLTNNMQADRVGMHLAANVHVFVDMTDRLCYSLYLVAQAATVQARLLYVAPATNNACSIAQQ